MMLPMILYFSGHWGRAGLLCPLILVLQERAHLHFTKGCFPHGGHKAAVVQLGGGPGDLDSHAAAV